ncbi:hypothetical protein DPMN_095091 [Dreissena polymorpha]|uniref:Uncharacterized protein n=1 Tax=Dreissena polymorpha TaxID=45954 RepID=A0A9D4L782_DREPO|nr:hypothetical protein DPMN_095091 [Dreissena polymorpha]
MCVFDSYNSLIYPSIEKLIKLAFALTPGHVELRILFRENQLLIVLFLPSKVMLCSKLPL